MKRYLIFVLPFLILFVLLSGCSSTPPNQTKESDNVLSAESRTVYRFKTYEQFLEFMKSVDSGKDKFLEYLQNTEPHGKWAFISDEMMGEHQRAVSLFETSFFPLHDTYPLKQIIFVPKFNRLTVLYGDSEDIVFEFLCVMQGDESRAEVESFLRTRIEESTFLYEEQAGKYLVKIYETGDYVKEY